MRSVAPVRLSPPPPSPIEGRSEESDDDSNNGSPTRVLDFDDDKQEEESKDTQSLSRNSLRIPEFYRPLSPPNILRTPSSRRRGTLPTLDEAVGSEEDEDYLDVTFDSSTDDDSLNYSPPRANSVKDLDSSDDTANKPNPRKLVRRKSSRQEKVQEMVEDARNLANTGQEDKAVLVYKKTLQINRAEVVRVKTQLLQIQGKHPATVESIADRLNEDWIKVGESIASIRTSMAVLYERSGDYARAISCCKEAKEVYKRQLKMLMKTGAATSHIEELDKQMDMMLGKMKQARGSFEDRKRLHEEIILLRKTITATDDSKQKEKLQKKVKTKALAAMKLEEDILGSEHPQVAETASILSELAIEEDDQEKALEYAETALSVVKVSLGEQHPMTGQKLLQIAETYCINGQDSANDDLALEYFDKAVDVFRLSGIHSHLVGSTLNDMAVIRIRRREYDTAVQLLSDALEAFGNLASNKLDKKICSDTVQIWRNLGECYFCRKEYESAANAFVSALDIQRDARKLYDASTVGTSREAKTRDPVASLLLVDDESIADTLRRLGRAYAGNGKHEHALMVLKEALLIHKIAVKKAMSVCKSRANPSLPEKQDELAHTMYCIAEVHDAIGEYDQASKLYSGSLELRLFSDAHKQDKRTNMVHCAMCLVGVGGIHMKKKEYRDALKVFMDALGYCEAHGKIWKGNFDLEMGLCVPIVAHRINYFECRRTRR